MPTVSQQKYIQELQSTLSPEEFEGFRSFAAERGTNIPSMTPQAGPPPSRKPLFPGGDYKMRQNPGGSQSNVLLSSHTFTQDDGSEKTFVVPNMAGGEEIDPWEEGGLVKRYGLENFPSFPTVPEAEDWIEKNHGNISPTGHLRTPLGQNGDVGKAAHAAGMFGRGAAEGALFAPRAVDHISAAGARRPGFVPMPGFPTHVPSPLTAEPEYPDPLEGPGHQMAQTIKEDYLSRLPLSEEHLDSFWLTDVPSGLGSAASFVGGHLAGGPMAPAMMGAGMMSTQAYMDARDKGLTHEGALPSSFAHLIPGALEAAPVGRLFGRASRGAKGFPAVMKATGEEALQEGVSGGMSDVITRGLVDPEHRLFEDVRREAQTGGAVGFILEGGRQLLTGGRKRRPLKATLTPEEFDRMGPMGEQEAQKTQIVEWDKGPQEDVGDLVPPPSEIPVSEKPAPRPAKQGRVESKEYKRPAEELEEQDDEYMRAVEAGDVDAAQKMVNEAVKLVAEDVGEVTQSTEPVVLDDEGNVIPLSKRFVPAKLERVPRDEVAPIEPVSEEVPRVGQTRFSDLSSTEYRGQHTAPDASSGAPMHAMDRDIYPDDIYSEDGARLYGSGGDSSARDKVIHRLLKEVRGNPDAKVTVYRGVPKGSDGDILPGDWVTPDLKYAEDHAFRYGEFEIYEKEVRAGDLFTEGNSLYEFGWSPAELTQEAAKVSVEDEEAPPQVSKPEVRPRIITAKEGREQPTGQRIKLMPSELKKAVSKYSILDSGGGPEGIGAKALTKVKSLNPDDRRFDRIYPVDPEKLTSDDKNRIDQVKELIEGIAGRKINVVPFAVQDESSLGLLGLRVDRNTVMVNVSMSDVPVTGDIMSETILHEFGHIVFSDSPELAKSFLDVFESVREESSPETRKRIDDWINRKAELYAGRTTDIEGVSILTEEGLVDILGSFVHDPELRKLMSEKIAADGNTDAASFLERFMKFIEKVMSRIRKYIERSEEGMTPFDKSEDSAFNPLATIFDDLTELRDAAAEMLIGYQRISKGVNKGEELLEWMDAELQDPDLSRAPIKEMEAKVGTKFTKELDLTEQEVAVSKTWMENMGSDKPTGRGLAGISLLRKIPGIKGINRDVMGKLSGDELALLTALIRQSLVLPEGAPLPPDLDMSDPNRNVSETDWRHFTYEKIYSLIRKEDPSIVLPRVPRGPLLTDRAIMEYAVQGVFGKEWYENSHETLTKDLKEGRGGSKYIYLVGSTATGAPTDNIRVASKHFFRDLAGIYHEGKDRSTLTKEEYKKAVDLVVNKLRILKKDSSPEGTQIAQVSAGLSGQMPTSFKLGDFGGALLLAHRIAVDTHMFGGVLGIQTKVDRMNPKTGKWEKPGLSDSSYDYVSGRIRHVARMMGLPPHQVQAMFWTGYKMAIGDQLQLLVERTAKSDKLSKSTRKLLVEAHDKASDFADFKEILEDRFKLGKGTDASLPVVASMEYLKRAVDGIKAMATLEYIKPVPSNAKLKARRDKEGTEYKGKWDEPKILKGDVRKYLKDNPKLTEALHFLHVLHGVKRKGHDLMMLIAQDLGTTGLEIAKIGDSVYKATGKRLVDEDRVNGIMFGPRTNETISLSIRNLDVEGVKDAKPVWSGHIASIVANRVGKYTKKARLIQIMKQEGVSKAERDWTGITTFMDSQKGDKILNDDIVEYLNSNAIFTQENWRFGPGLYPESKYAKYVIPEQAREKVSDEFKSQDVKRNTEEAVELMNKEPDADNWEPVPYPSAKDDSPSLGRNYQEIANAVKKYHNFDGDRISAVGDFGIPVPEEHALSGNAWMTGASQEAEAQILSDYVGGRERPSKAGWLPSFPYAGEGDDRAMIKRVPIPGTDKFGLIIDTYHAKSSYTGQKGSRRSLGLPKDLMKKLNIKDGTSGVRMYVDPRGVDAIGLPLSMLTSLEDSDLSSVYNPFPLVALENFADSIHILNYFWEDSNLPRVFQYITPEDLRAGKISKSDLHIDSKWIRHMSVRDIMEIHAKKSMGAEDILGVGPKLIGDTRYGRAQHYGAAMGQEVFEYTMTIDPKTLKGPIAERWLDKDRDMGRPHWTEESERGELVILHVRGDIRMGPEGKYIFIQEIQSDWKKRHGTGMRVISSSVASKVVKFAQKLVKDPKKESEILATLKDTPLDNTIDNLVGHFFSLLKENKEKRDKRLRKSVEKGRYATLNKAKDNYNQDDMESRFRSIYENMPLEEQMDLVDELGISHVGGEIFFPWKSRVEEMAIIRMLRLAAQNNMAGVSIVNEDMARVTRSLLTHVSEIKVDASEVVRGDWIKGTPSRGKWLKEYGRTSDVDYISPKFDEINNPSLEFKYTPVGRGERTRYVPVKELSDHVGSRPHKSMLGWLESVDELFMGYALEVPDEIALGMDIGSILDRAMKDKGAGKVVMRDLKEAGAFPFPGQLWRFIAKYNLDDVIESLDVTDPLGEVMADSDAMLDIVREEVGGVHVVPEDDMKITKGKGDRFIRKVYGAAGVPKVFREISELLGVDIVPAYMNVAPEQAKGPKLLQQDADIIEIRTKDDQGNDIPPSAYPGDIANRLEVLKLDDNNTATVNNFTSPSMSLEDVGILPEGTNATEDDMTDTERVVAETFAPPARRVRVIRRMPKTTRPFLSDVEKKILRRSIMGLFPDAAKHLIDKRMSIKDAPHNQVVRDKDVYKEAEAMRANEGTEALLDRIIKKIDAGDTPSFPEVVIMRDIVREKTLVSWSNRNTEDTARNAKLIQALTAWESMGSDEARRLRLRRMPGLTEDQWRFQIVSEAILMPSPDERKAIKAAEGDKEKLDKIYEDIAERAGEMADKLEKHGLFVDKLAEDMKDKYMAAKWLREISALTSGFGDAWHEYYISAILGGTGTHVVNFSGNLANSLHNELTRVVEASINSLGSGDPDSAQGIGELKAVWKHALSPKNIMRAMGRALKSFRTGMPEFESEILGVDPASPGGAGIKYEARKWVAIGGLKGQIVRAAGPSTLLLMDEFFKSLIGGMNATAHAYREAKKQGKTGAAAEKVVNELVDDLSSDSWMYGLYKAREGTFQKELPETVKFAQRLRDANIWWTTIAPLRFQIPFVKTLYNLVASAVAKSPLGIIRAIPRFPDTAQGKEDVTTRTHIMAEFIVGSALSIFIASMMRSGEDDEEPWLDITGNIPWKRHRFGELQFASDTRPKTTIKIGDTRFDYSRIEPIGPLMAMIVDAVTEYDNAVNKGKDASAAMKTYLDNVSGMMYEKTMLGGLLDVLRVGEDLTTADKVARWASNFASAHVPNIYRQFRKVDPTLKEKGVWGDTFLERVEKGAGRVVYSMIEPLVPGAEPTEDNIIPFSKVGRWGFPKGDLRGDATPPASDFVFRIMGLNKISPEDRTFDDVNKQKAWDRSRELNRLLTNYNNKYPSDMFTDKWPKRKVEIEERKYSLSDKEYHDMQVMGGTHALKILMNKRLNVDDPTPADKKKIEDAFSKGRSVSKAAAKKALARRKLRERKAGKSKRMFVNLGPMRGGSWVDRPPPRTPLGQ